MAIQPNEVDRLRAGKEVLRIVAEIEDAIDVYINQLALADSGPKSPEKGFEFQLDSRWDVSPLILQELRSRYSGWDISLVDRTFLRFVPRVS